MAKPKNIPLFLLRLLALAATLSGTIVMATSHESTTIFNLTFEAKYSDTPAFKFFVIVNAVGSVYTLLVLFLPSESLFRRISVAVDVVITVLLTSGSSAALGIAYVGKKGNTHAGWLPICDQVPNFCNQVTGSLVAGFIGVILYMLLILHSVHTVLNPL